MSYFISRTTRLYSWAVNRHVYTLYATTALVILCASMAWYFACYSLIDRYIVRYQSEQNSIEKSCLFVENNKASRKQVQDSVYAMLTQIRALSAEHMYTARATLLDQLTAGGILLNAFHSEQEQEREGMLSQKIAIDAQGSLENILQWIAKSAQLPILLTINYVTLSKIGAKDWRMKCELDFSLIKNDEKEKSLQLFREKS